MKQSFFVALSALLVLSCGSRTESQITKEKNKEGLFGNVKSFTEITYATKNVFGKMELGDEVRKTIVSYNQDGTVKQRDVWEDGQYEEREVFTYDGNTIVEDSYDGEDGSPLSKKITTLGEKGKPIRVEETLFVSDNPTFIYVYSYEYDSSGNLIKETTALSFGETEILYMYDSQNRVIKETHFTREIYDGELYREEKSYEEVYQYDSENLLYVFRLAYGDYAYSTCKEYNSFGDCIKAYSIDGISTDVKEFSLYAESEYEYDKRGNWIKATSYDRERKTDIPSSIDIREIKYY